MERKAVHAQSESSNCYNMLEIYHAQKQSVEWQQQLIDQIGQEVDALSEAILSENDRAKRTALENEQRKVFEKHQKAEEDKLRLIDEMNATANDYAISGCAAVPGPLL